jgi:galactitol-specific phosphotransferase system IIB component
MTSSLSGSVGINDVVSDENVNVDDESTTTEEAGSGYGGFSLVVSTDDEPATIDESDDGDIILVVEIIFSYY